MSMDSPSRKNVMPRFIGAIVSLVSLIAGIIARIEPVLCLERAAIAFGAGWLAGSIWQVVVDLTVKPEPVEETPPESEPEVESEVVEEATKAEEVIETVEEN